MKWIFLVFLLCLSFVSALDNESVVLCGGDSETLFLCVGDEENSIFGESFYIEPTVAPPQGGTGTGGSSGTKFDDSAICTYTGAFLRGEFETTPNRTELLSWINRDSLINISEGTLDMYLIDFENKCNETLEPKEIEPEEEKKVYYIPILFIIFLLILVIYYKKITDYMLTLLEKNNELSKLLKGN